MLYAPRQSTTGPCKGMSYHRSVDDPSQNLDRKEVVLYDGPIYIDFCKRQESSVMIQTQGHVTTRRWEEKSIGRKEAQGNFWDDRRVPYLDLGVRQMG